VVGGVAPPPPLTAAIILVVFSIQMFNDDIYGGFSHGYLPHVSPMYVQIQGGGGRGKDGSDTEKLRQLYMFENLPMLVLRTVKQLFMSRFKMEVLGSNNDTRNIYPSGPNRFPVEKKFSVPASEHPAGSGLSSGSGPNQTLALI